MTSKQLQSQITLGEDSKRHFKVDVRNAESLAAEMAAFANSEGGVILIGVADDSSTPRLSLKEVSRINQLISNAASQLVRSPLTVQTQNAPLGKEHVVIIFTVPKGIDKPYFVVKAIHISDYLDTEDFEGSLTGHSLYLLGQPDPINDLLNKIRETPKADYPTLARVLQVCEATVQRHIQRLKQQNRVRRVGSKKTGHWEIIE